MINDELDEQIFDFKMLNKNLDQKIHLLDRKKLTMTKKMIIISASILRRWLKSRHYDFKNPWNNINSSRTWCVKFHITFWNLDLEFGIHSSFFVWKTVFIKFDEVIVTSSLVVQVWEVIISGFWKSSPSGIIINS